MKLSLIDFAGFKTRDSFAGIGRDIALSLAKCGAEVVALTRSKADLDTLVVEVHDQSTCLILM